MKSAFLFSTAVFFAAAGTDAAVLTGGGSSIPYGHQDYEVVGSDPAGAAAASTTTGGRMMRAAAAATNYDYMEAAAAASHGENNNREKMYGEESAAYNSYGGGVSSQHENAAGDIHHQHHLQHAHSHLNDDNSNRNDYHHLHPHPQQQQHSNVQQQRPASVADEHEAKAQQIERAASAAASSSSSSSPALVLMELSEVERKLVEAMRLKARELKKSIGSGPAGWGVEQYFTPHRVVSYEKEVAPGNVIVDGYQVDPHTVDGFYFPATTAQYAVAPGSDAALPVIPPRTLETGAAYDGFFYDGVDRSLPTAAVAVPLLPNAARLPVPAPPAFPAGLNYNVPSNTVNVGGVGTIVRPSTYSRLVRNLKKIPSAGPTGYGVEQHYQPHQVMDYDWRPSYEDYIVLGGPPRSDRLMFSPSYRTDGVPGIPRGLENTQYLYYAVNPATGTTALPPLTNNVNGFTLLNQPPPLTTTTTSFDPLMTTTPSIIGSSSSTDPYYYYY